MSGDVAGEAVGAVVTAEQRHDVGAILRDGQHRRLGGLVAQVRCEETDENAGSADADDRAAFGEEVIDHYTRAAEWEQEEYDRRVTDWEVARGFERA